jgi:predicted phosphoadenosine phosphosulfate sulfurtransferase
MKIYKDINVYEESLSRLEFIFKEFDKVYTCFSGGKDSTVLLDLSANIARKNNKRLGVLIVDLEAQYRDTIVQIENMLERHKDILDVYWVAIPLSLRNSISSVQPQWVCWDETKKDLWVRQKPANAIESFPFYIKNMEFEDFIVDFGKWYSAGQNTACLVGIRTDESLNRFRTIASEVKEKYNNINYSTKVDDNLFNFYPIYDWRTSDIWIYHRNNQDCPYNPIYEKMYKAGVKFKNMRLCQPYGDDQKQGIDLWHILEPETWNLILQRVHCVNFGAIYKKGLITGVGKLQNPPQGFTWKSYSIFILKNLPDNISKHYATKIRKFIKWWQNSGYTQIPDFADYTLESNRSVPSWRRICKVLLKNDYWCKGIGFSQPKSKKCD